MARKKTKIPIKEKLHYKKPVKTCNIAIDDITRIRNNEQAKLRRLSAKFKAIPRGKQKKQADALRKEIKRQDKAIDQLKGTISDIRTACSVFDGNKSKVKSLKLKNDAINRKMHKMARKDVGGPEFKKLQNEYLRQAKAVKELQSLNNDILYRVNKHLGFNPEVIADRFNISKDYLEKHHKEDFDEEYFEELEQVGPTGMGGGFVPEEIEEEIEAEEEPGYNLEMDEIFWQVSQDFTKNEINNLTGYDSVIIEFNGSTHRFKGTSLSLITLTFSEAIRWSETRPPYVLIAKYLSTDQTKLKYVFYEN
jgi:hypothetical protein